MSKATLQWLYRLGMGAAVAALEAVERVIAGADFSEMGLPVALAGVVGTVAAWLLGKGIGALKAQG